MDSSDKNKSIPTLVKEAYTLALQGEPIEAEKVDKSKRGTKAKLKYQEDDIRGVVESAKKNKISAYEALKLAEIIRDDPVKDFLGIGVCQ